jgi:hypothetical protein
MKLLSLHSSWCRYSPPDVKVKEVYRTDVEIMSLNLNNLTLLRYAEVGGPKTDNFQMFLYQIWRCLNTHEPADFHSDP